LSSCKKKGRVLVKAVVFSFAAMYSRSPLCLFQRSLAAQAASKHSVAEAAPAIKTKKLENGLIVAGIDTGAKLASVGVLTKAGSRYETYENAGLTHALRASFGLASSKFTGFGITRHIQQAGANVTAAGGRDYLLYSTHFVRGAKNQHVLDYMFDAISNPKFRHWEIPAAHQKVKLQALELSPNAKATELLHKAAYRNGGLGNSIYCPEHMIGKHKCVDLEAFHKKHVTADRSILVGINMEFTHLLEYASSLELESGAGPSAGATTYFGGDARLDATGPLAHVAIAAEAGNVVTNMKEAGANFLLKIILGDGQKLKYGTLSGKLPKALPSEGLHAVSGFYTAYDGSSLNGAFISTDAATAGENVTKVAQALRSIEVSEAEFLAAKKAAAVVLGEASLNPAETLQMIGGSLYHADIDNFEKAGNLMDQITLADVQAAAKKLSNAKLSVGAVGNLVNVPYADSL